MLPSVYSQKIGVRIPGDDTPEGLESMYEEAIQLLKTKGSTEQPLTPEFDVELKRFRTLIMASWALSNGMLVFFVLNSNFVGEDVDPRGGIKFVMFLLWGFAVLTGIKFVGALYYVVSQGSWHAERGKRSKSKAN